MKRTDKAIGSEQLKVRWGGGGRAWAIAILLLVAALGVANVNRFGAFYGGHFDWECDSCGAFLYLSPAKNICFLRVTAEYQVHRHLWQCLHRPPEWSAWKPWHWLVLATQESRVVPDPSLLFPTAPLNSRSDPRGIRVLATDPVYLLKLIESFDEPSSRPLGP